MFLDNRTSQSLYHLNVFNKYASQAQTLVYKEINYASRTHSAKLTIFFSHFGRPDSEISRGRRYG